jgi:ABC-2 type transport system permease protein
MSTASYPVADSATMLRRNLRHALRYPSVTIGTVAVPVLILLLFVGLFGHTLGAGLARASGGISYIDYVAPGILAMTVASGAGSTAVSVCTDMTGGIMNRFRTMAISRSSVLIGQVAGGFIQTMISVALVIGVALLMGFRPTAGPLEWATAIGFLALVALAITWLAVAIGIVAKSPVNASNTPLLIQFLPFISSAFVPTASMPAGVRLFAEYQPFTPVIKTLRGLLMGAPIGNGALIAVAWCAGITLAGYLWARVAFERGGAR